MWSGDVRRQPLGHWPTPLVPWPRLSAELGRPVWAKRDDLSGFGLGGNKARKLEYLLGDAAEAGCDTLVAVGGPQSNFCRMVAAAARACGLDAELVLEGPDPGTRTGNLAADVLYGAGLHFVAEDSGEAWAAEFGEHLRRQGRRPYVMPIGGSTAVGNLGYVAATVEFLAQVTAAGLDVGQVVVAAGSCGTLAGLLVGSAHLGSPWRVLGVSVSAPAAAKQATTDALAAELAARLGWPAPPPAEVTDRFTAGGYGSSDATTWSAIRRLARAEGVLVDPVYTAKALAAAVADDLAPRRGATVFWHTGGVPALLGLDVKEGDTANNR